MEHFHSQNHKYQKHKFQLKLILPFISSSLVKSSKNFPVKIAICNIFFQFLKDFYICRIGFDFSCNWVGGFKNEGWRIGL